MADLYDVIVVGAGIEGSATSFQLSRRGVKVLLLEQFPLPHPRGSSHGASRIIRKAYPEKFYTEMMNYCVPEWERIQREGGQTVFKQIGYMYVGALTGTKMQNEIASMECMNAPFKVLSPQSFRRKYPNLQFEEDVGALFDPSGGILVADKALQTFQKLFVKQGGELRDGEKVESIQPGEIIHVVTSKQKYKCRSLVMCCGPWTNQALSSLDLKLPLVPVKISVCYWPEKVPGTYSSDYLQPFSDARDTSVASSHHAYALPSDEYPGHVKICLHNGPEIDPENRDAVDSQWVIDIMKRYVTAHFPGLVPDPSIVESCIYTNTLYPQGVLWPAPCPAVLNTELENFGSDRKSKQNTPDMNFILDFHPQWKNIVVGAGFSGHGFKLSPAVGNILADLSLGKTPEYDVSHFKIDRFNQALFKHKL